MANTEHLHSAAPSAAGYLYQARLALVECLRYAYVDSAIEVAIEKFDDVSFEKEGSALEMLQTKHHLNKAGNLSDTSVDLWKTLRVWAEATKSDPSLPRRMRFTLVTTARAPDGSAASFLCSSGNSPHARNVDQAEELLMQAAASSKNTVLEKAITAFTSLTPAIRKELLNAIEILDGKPLISDLDAAIENQLRMIAPRGKQGIAREQLEGWWWPRICAALQMETTGTVAVLEVEQKLDDIRDSLKRDALPLDMEDAEPSPEDLDSFEEMRFVQQLRSIGVGNSRMQYAKRDFYRASTQRSRWARLSLLFDGEMSRFEKKLIEEWQPRFAAMCENFTPGCDETVLCQEGRNLYGWVENDARFPIRMQSSRFLNVGSYHILAENLRVGWHRDYKEIHADKAEDIIND